MTAKAKAAATSQLISLAKDSLLEQRLKKHDYVDLPMDEAFYDQLHERIMHAVEKTEVKQLNRWAKTWVFLETQGRLWRPALPEKLAKKKQ